MITVYTVVLLLDKNSRHNKWILIGLILSGIPAAGFTFAEGGLNWYEFNPYLQNPVFAIAPYPALYLYIKALVHPERGNRVLDILHFVPTIVLYIISLAAGWMTRTYLEDTSFQSYVQLISVATISSALVYFLLIHRLVKTNAVKYKEEYAQENIFISLRWVYYLLGLLITITCAGVSFGLLYPEILEVAVEEFLTGSILLFTMTLSYFCVKQQTLFIAEDARQSTPKPEHLPSPPHVVCTSNSKDSEKDRVYLEKICNYMEEHRPYLNPKLRMQELVDILDIPRHVFSRLINEHYNLNFFHFVNQYRIKYVLEHLTVENLETYTVEAIAFNAGFNSKSTFYKSFKEITGENPGQYVAKMYG